MNNNNLSDSDQDDDEQVSEIRGRAFRILTRREHSAFELRKKLSRYASDRILALVLEQFEKDGYQSDERFAEMLCRTRVSNGKGPVKIRYELNEHHIDTTIIDSCMAEFDGQWQALANEVRIRKFGSAPPVDYTEWARQARFLQQRGFSSEYIDSYT